MNTSPHDEPPADAPPPSPYINLADPRQDVHRVRTQPPHQLRYAIAEQIFPDGPFLDILDLGGGTGDFARRLRERNYAVTFADLSESNVRRAAEDGFAAHRVDLNFTLPFGDALFDGVTMLEVIEHVVASEQLLAEVHRILRPRGFVVLSTPNFSFFVNRFRVLRGKLSVDEGYHYRFFNPQVLRMMVERAGFEVEATDQTMPAFGINRVSRLVGRAKRRHIRVPAVVAGFAAQTLFVRARKA